MLKKAEIKQVDIVFLKTRWHAALPGLITQSYIQYCNAFILAFIFYPILAFQ